MSLAVCELLPLFVYICTFIAFFFPHSVHMLVHFVGHVCSESIQRSLSIGVRVHILWTIAQQKRDDCMIRPRQAILCLFEEEGAPSSPEQVFLRLSSPPAPRAPIATVSRWKFPKKSCVRFSIMLSSHSRHFFPLRVIFLFLNLTQSERHAMTEGLCKRPPVNLP